MSAIEEIFRKKVSFFGVQDAENFCVERVIRFAKGSVSENPNMISVYEISERIEQRYDYIKNKTVKRLITKYRNTSVWVGAPMEYVRIYSGYPECEKDINETVTTL